MQLIRLPFSSTGQFPPLFIDYLEGKKELAPYYAYRPDLASFKKAVDDLSAKPFNRDLLHRVLKDQYAASGLPLPEAAGLLLKSNTFTITAGHQLCLFTGPLYFVYKILSSIHLAEKLRETYPGFHFVPAYWMASEDHDFEEVNHAYLFGKKVVWNTGQQGAVGTFDTTSLKEVIAELKGMLGESANARELSELIEKAYLGNRDLASATRYLVHSLFSGMGLVVVDGNDARLKKEFAGIMKDDLTNHTNQRLVDQTIAELDKMGYKNQVNPREINLFKLGPDSRVRIDNPNDGLVNELEAHPERFSPNVVLRPLYQQLILPNLAYVGGPGELAYWMEYKRMFDHHDVFFPVLVPRNSLVALDRRQAELLHRNGLHPSDIFLDTETLVKKAVEYNSGEQVSLSKEEEELRKVYNTLSEKVQLTDKTLKAAAEAELQKALNGLKNLEGKLIKAEKQRQENTVNQLRKLKDKLLPGGALQERHDNFIPYYLQEGSGYFKRLKELFDPLQLQLFITSE